MGKGSYTVNSLWDFVRFVERECPGEYVLFRGQPCDRSLLPKIARDDFVVQGDRLQAERRMLEDFRRQALPLLDIQPQTDWDWLAVAQHHGMATRLLDWTLNPLAALWFAVEKPPVSDGHGVVWFFEADDGDYTDTVSMKDPFAAKRTCVFRPRHIAHRITAQAAWFTAHKYQEAGHFVPLDRNKHFKNRLTRLEVPALRFASLRRELDRCGVNASTLYGGVDGLCRHIEWRHSFLTDEMSEMLQKAT